MKTKVVNIFGGPGVGKSMIRACIFSVLKMEGKLVEEVVEFPKELVWEGNNTALACQPYIFGNQLYRISRLIGKVEYVIVDSPILLSVIYARKFNMSKHFEEMVFEVFSEFDNINLYLDREGIPYENVGRQFSLREAKLIDEEILQLLKERNVKYETSNSNRPDEIMKKLNFSIGK